MSKKATDKQRKSKSHQHEAMSKTSMTVAVRVQAIKTLPVGPSEAEWDRITTTIRQIPVGKVFGPIQAK